MFYETAQGRSLIVDVSRQIVDEVAPEEADLFDELLAEYDAGHFAAVTELAESDDPLGFGIGEGLSLATPAVIAAVSAVLTYIAEQALETVKTEGAAAVRERVSAALKPAGRKTPTDTDPALQLTREQLRTLHTLARQKGEEFGMPAADAGRMADALLGAVVLA